VPIATVDGLRLYYESYGQGSAVVVIPGLGADSRLFRAFAQQLSVANRVVVLDPRGSGQSDKPDGPYSIDQMTDDLRGLIAALDLGVCDIVGYSMGGRVALNFAANYPREVRRLVLAATSARSAPSSKFSWRWFAMEVLSRVPSPRWFDPQPRKAFGAQRRASSDFDGRELLHKVEAPTLVVRARKDRIVPTELLAELGGIPRGEHVTLPGGHLSLVLLHSRDLAIAVRSFLTST
jgi:pimeloyl-ACP methyl ester carboxylesterase